MIWRVIYHKYKFWGNQGQRRIKSYLSMELNQEGRNFPSWHGPALKLCLHGLLLFPTQRWPGSTKNFMVLNCITVAKRKANNIQGYSSSNWAFCTNCLPRLRYVASADGFMSGQFTNIDVCIWKKLGLKTAMSLIRRGLLGISNTQRKKKANVLTTCIYSLFKP